MTLLLVSLHVVAVVLGLHVLGLYLLVELDDVGEAAGTVRENLREIAPTAAVLVLVLGINGVVRKAGVDISWLIGVNVTGYIHATEGAVVADLQSIATPALTDYFSFVYVFGYVFLVTFPVAAYAIEDDGRPLQNTLIAYGLNYGLGLVCYVFVVAYGPRNFMPELVDSLLYTTWPDSQLLTSQVNANTNVFPSLHTSLSVTVALIAYRFRGTYPRWTPVAIFLAASIAVSTMYLGIHWLLDVLGGIVLAVASVRLAPPLSERVGDGGVRVLPGSLTDAVARRLEKIG